MMDDCSSRSSCVSSLIWLNMAEIECSMLTRQSLHRRIGLPTELEHEVAAWQSKRNWRFGQMPLGRGITRNHLLNEGVEVFQNEWYRKYNAKSGN